MPNRREDGKSARIEARRHGPACRPEILALFRSAGAKVTAAEMFETTGLRRATRWCAKPGLGPEHDLMQFAALIQRTGWAISLAQITCSNHVPRQPARH